MENLIDAWYEFRRGKRKKSDVENFEFNLEDNLWQLHEGLKSGTHKLDPYQMFYVCDPKLRCIHKASVRDRVLYQAVYRQLYPIFDRHFIHDSYSCRNNKGTHAGVARLETFLRKVSGNFKRPAWALKCDVKKFFDSIDHLILLGLIARKVTDDKVLCLISKVLTSFEKSPGKGLPLGNVTSQLFANIYLNELDQFVKHSLKQKHYVRYADDFVIVGQDYASLESLIELMGSFLAEKLKLKLHPNKITVRKLSHGVDFLGYVILPYHRILRTKTKNRILKKVSREKLSENHLQSYLGILRHCRGFKMVKRILKANS